MNNLRTKYLQEVVPKMKQDCLLKNDNEVPRLEKVVINAGIGKALKDERFMDIVSHTLTQISGQKPAKMRAKKSIAAFKIREGMTVGMKVTLRGRRMYDFVEKLIHVVLPRVRDFRGISPSSMDGNGNVSIGVKEHIVFPEINPEEVDRLHGLEVAISTTAGNNTLGFKLLKEIGFPFKDDVDTVKKKPSLRKASYKR
jgi:large subunit ribosomal protein L5